MDFFGGCISLYRRAQRWGFHYYRMRYALNPYEIAVPEYTCWHFADGMDADSSDPESGRIMLSVLRYLR